MSSLFDYFSNSSIINGVLVYLSTLEVYLSDETIEILPEPDQLTAGVLDFNDFQLKLLTVFSGCLVFNLLLLFASWKYYGADIYDRFLKPSSIKEIEELKASLSRFKLPKEHTSRI